LATSFFLMSLSADSTKRVCFSSVKNNKDEKVKF